MRTKQLVIILPGLGDTSVSGSAAERSDGGMRVGWGMMGGVMGASWQRHFPWAAQGALSGLRLSLYRASGQKDLRRAGP